MTDFTYEFPDSNNFLYTLRKYLEQTDKEQISTLLINSRCEFMGSSSFSHIRYNSYDATIRFIVPVISISKFTEKVKKDLLYAVDSIFPKEIGYEITDLEISPILESPPDDDDTSLNSASLVSKGTIEHDGLRFRSKSEIKIYDELKKRHVLFFANATAVLGSKNTKREPDFLICQNGKWGILEVMGEQYHPSNTAMRDHDRARLFKDYGLFHIEFYNATECYSKPDKVVDKFLQYLSKT
jgi:hypothetical protein